MSNNFYIDHLIEKLMKFSLKTRYWFQQHKVITTKSVEYMPFFLSLANFANGCIWTAYALIKLDIYILVTKLQFRVHNIINGNPAC